MCVSVDFDGVYQSILTAFVLYVLLMSTSLFLVYLSSGQTWIRTSPSPFNHL